MLCYKLFSKCFFQQKFLEVESSLCIAIIATFGSPRKVLELSQAMLMKKICNAVNTFIIVPVWHYIITYYLVDTLLDIKILQKKAPSIQILTLFSWFYCFANSPMFPWLQNWEISYTGICECQKSKIKGEVSPNNNVDWVSRKQFYKPNTTILSKFG